MGNVIPPNDKIRCLSLWVLWMCILFVSADTIFFSFVVEVGILEAGRSKAGATLAFLKNIDPMKKCTNVFKCILGVNGIWKGSLIRTEVL